MSLLVALLFAIQVQDASREVFSNFPIEAGVRAELARSRAQPGEVFGRLDVILRPLTECMNYQTRMVDVPAHDRNLAAAQTFLAQQAVSCDYPGAKARVSELLGEDRSLPPARAEQMAISLTNEAVLFGATTVLDQFGVIPSGPSLAVSRQCGPDIRSNCIQRNQETSDAQNQ